MILIRKARAALYWVFQHTTTQQEDKQNTHTACKLTLNTQHTPYFA